MDLVPPLREAKHRAYVLARSAKLRLNPLRDRFWTATHPASRYSYRPERYENEHMEPGRSSSATFPVDHLFLGPRRELAGPAEPAPARLFLLWTGTNPITPNRQASIESLRAENPDLEIVLVTPENLDRYVAPGHPLHPAYEHLSAVHRSDYLRAYLMHHWGGAYSDIKRVAGKLSDLLTALNADDGLWATGMAERSPDCVGDASGRLGRDQRRYFAATVAQNLFAFRPHTPLTEEWLAEVERRLDYFSSLLAEHPAQDPFGQTGDYPVPWYSLLASVMNPLNLKYLDRVRPLPGYRFLGSEAIENYR